MPQVVLLRGVNVGGHRTFRPTQLVEKLKRYDITNIGAAGTFVVRGKTTQASLRRAVAQALPFDADIVIVPGRDVLRLVEREPFAGQPGRKDVIWFVSTLVRKPRREPEIPLTIPATGQWDLRLLERDDRFVLGMYRRHMKAIGHLGKIDDWFGVPATTRNWNTMNAIAKVLAP